MTDKQLTVTLKEIGLTRACEVLLKYLGKKKADDTPVSFHTILGICGLDDALRCLYALPRDMDGRVRELACDFAEPALKYVPGGEDRPRIAIETSRRYARGECSQDELAAAKCAAIYAAHDAGERLQDELDAAHDEVKASDAEDCIPPTDISRAAFWAAFTASWAAKENWPDPIDTARTAIFVAWAAPGAIGSGDALIAAARVEQEQIFLNWLDDVESEHD